MDLTRVIQESCSLTYHVHVFDPEAGHKVMQNRETPLRPIDLDHCLAIIDRARRRYVRHSRQLRVTVALSAGVSGALLLASCARLWSLGALGLVGLVGAATLSGVVLQRLARTYQRELQQLDEFLLIKYKILEPQAVVFRWQNIDGSRGYVNLHPEPYMW